MRIVAILAAYNEERFIGGCLDHLIDQGVEAYLIDNSSTDRTVEIAESYLGRGLIGIENLPRLGGVHRWPVVLRRKQELASSIEADWFIHMDPDEIRLSPHPDRQTLAEAFEEVDAQGYNAVNFLEYTFIPTKESPEHDHPDFQKTMRWYYPFMLRFPQQIKAWKRQPEPVNLVRSGGHFVRFPDLRLYPETFTMRHYQFLSLEQARVKYLQKKNFDPAQIKKNFWRAWMIEERMQLPLETEFNVYTTDAELSISNPRTRHVIEDWALPEGERTDPADGTGGPKGPKHQAAPEGRRDARMKTGPANQLLVAGFHRSGTSLTAQLLNRSGVFLGYQMLGQHRSNRHGHFEDREIVTFHDKVLTDNGLTWQVDGSSLPVVGEAHRRRMREISEKRNDEQEIWGFKDPRVCLFMDDWKRLLPDARVLLVYRSFAESTHSLHRRAANGLRFGMGRPEFHRKFLEEPDLALKMWLAHNRALVDFARAYPEDVLVVSFDMLRNGFPLIRTLNQYWGLTLKEVPTQRVFDPDATAEPAGKQVVYDEKLITEVLDTWEALEELGRRTEELTGIPVITGEKLTEKAFYKPEDEYALEMEKVFASFESPEAPELLEKARNPQNVAGKPGAEIKQVRSGSGGNSISRRREVKPKKKPGPTNQNRRPDMPIAKSRVVLEVAKGLTAFLNLDAGLTRGQAPSPEQDLWRVQRQLGERERQLREKDRRLREQNQRLDRVQKSHGKLRANNHKLRENNQKLRAALPQPANKKQAADGQDRERILRMVGGMWEEMGELQFDFLREQGLKPEHLFLDVGCGILRGGIHFIPYLEPGHYYGIDKNRELLNFGRKEMEKAGLQERRPTLVQIEDFGFERLGQTFDYALAQSVFTHLPLNYISRCLINVDRVLRPGGVFFATFFENRSGKRHLDSIVQRDGVISYYDKDPFHYTLDAFEWACEGTSLKAEYIGDWSHPRHQLMLAFKKAET